MSQSKLNKKLYTDITRLKLLDTSTAPIRFRIRTTPFTGDEDEDQLNNQAQTEYVITGQIFPKSNIYNQRSYMVEMKLTRTFPIDPPEVRFLTKIYHPNIDVDGKFCAALLQKTAKWTIDTSLVNVISAVVDHVDHPNPDYAASLELGKQYIERRSEFDAEALRYVREYGLPL